MVVLRINRYALHLLGTLPHRLDGIHVVIDCAHGAAAAVSPQVFADAGAKITVIGAEPDGNNINDGVGSTHLDLLAAKVLEVGADVGIAHDGDADRCLAVDAEGGVIDGDHIMAILAIAMKDRGRLPDNTLVTTVMSKVVMTTMPRTRGIIEPASEPNCLCRPTARVMACLEIDRPALTR